ncbi:O-antigen polysaccharide polymerase Wzy family protein [Pseudomonas aeruginosa]|uniref:O-antigen polysaccharide polymerase Wzy n=1 Tax=Pseudomonas aeruginosa TaxID=287 RepID=UPI00163C647D|nr:O-antigen polysaccharide polymerase Wzy [Pseudomonas aeruginosa]MBG4707643.1 O-antigen polysaccharide polymerase Wzy [Pseudomonas aeruginosa]MBI8511438.1 O-antigen polysaccharide polymerase Wzy [Pseudomonas aeruginosa]MCS7673255.1 O-antigen polysaccharide polymerase Wzy family protein [Pseudomonas aeruginosa]MCS9862729.1 O-antigen polysaccharide polymerase Wzy family protein [Pseudomonas aeruginosa]HCF6816365.1 O-antigen polysaccharide polymerase Wzy [Pseudomonas aeruginosa]
MIKSSKTLLFGFLILVFLFVCYFFSFDVSSYVDELSIAFIVLALFVYIFLSFLSLGFKPTSLTVLFFVSTAVFIFGRFFSKILNPDVDIFAIDFFATYKLTPYDGVRLGFLSMIFLFSMYMGAVLGRDIKFKLGSSGGVEEGGGHFSPMLRMVIFFLVVIICSINLYVEYRNYVISSSDGYLSLYSFQGEAYAGGKFFKSLFYIALGLSYSFCLEREKKIIILSLFVMGLLSLLAGQRGGFVISLFMLLWAYGINHKVSWFGVLAAFSLFFLSLVLFGSLSARSLAVNLDSGWLGFVSKFLYDQGISLMVFDVSTKVSDYPLVATIQNFVPGASRLASIFYDLRMQDVSYADYLAYHLDPVTYLGGLGLGWSLPSTFYIWSFEQVFLFSAFSACFGFLLKTLDNKTLSSSFFLGLAACLVSVIIILPRSQFSNVIPLAIYFCVFFPVFSAFAKKSKYIMSSPVSDRG